MDCSTPGIPVLHYLLEFTQTHVHWISDAFQPSHPLSPPSPPALNVFLASGSFPMSRPFASGGQKIGASASASVLPVYIQFWFPLGLTGLIFFAVQGTLKSLLHHHNSNASILQCSVFFMVQLLHPYMTTRKTITLTVHTFVGIAVSLLLNTLSSFVITFLPKSKCFLISWLQSPSTVILEPKSLSLFPFQ